MFNLEYQEILNNLQVWGYPLMFLLMTIEGPIATMAGAFLASLGFFNVFIVLILSIVGDLIADIIIYYFGFFSGKNSFQLNQKKLIQKIKESFRKRGDNLFFLTKITIGLSLVTFSLAGASKFSFKKFLLFSLLGGVVWSSFIVVLGYFFGKMAEIIEEYIKFGGWIVFLIAVLTIIIIVIRQKKVLLNKKLNNNQTK
jgi:membrane protein DedA with SNARE-associated domain